MVKLTDKDSDVKRWGGGFSEGVFYEYFKVIQMENVYITKFS